VVERQVSAKNLYGESLAGVEDRPEVALGQYPAAVFVHGFSGDKDEGGMFVSFAEALTAHGLLVYRFDLSGCGESQGRYADTTLTKLAEDVRAALDFVKRQPIVDAARLGLLGFSLGATTALALRPRDVRCLMLLGAVAHPYEVLQVLFDEGFRPSGTSSRLTSRGQRVEVGPQFWQDFQRYDIPAEMKKLHVPTLFLHGERDDTVPLTEAQALFAVAANPKELVVIPGDRHKLTNPLAAERLLEWCERYLR
jgi:pimeloyl-ACP methyl ester carboxylesterase